MKGPKSKNQDTGYMQWSIRWHTYARDLVARPSTFLQVRADSAWRLGFRHMYTGLDQDLSRIIQISRRVSGWRVARILSKCYQGRSGPELQPCVSTNCLCTSTVDLQHDLHLWRKLAYKMASSSLESTDFYSYASSCIFLMLGSLLVGVRSC